MTVTHTPSPHRIAIAGSTGRMGHMLIEAVLAADDCVLAGALDRYDSPALGEDATARATAAVALQGLAPEEFAALARDVVHDDDDDDRVRATVITALDGVAWVLNIRGTDVANTPVALSYVVVKADGTAELFIAPEKVTPALTQHLGNAVSVRPRGEFQPALGEVARHGPGEAGARRRVVDVDGDLLGRQGLRVEGGAGRLGGAGGPGRRPAGSRRRRAGRSRCRPRGCPCG